MQSSETDELDEIIPQSVHRVGSHSDDYGGDSDKPCFCQLKPDIQAYIDKHYISKQRVVEAFKLLEHGHGGGNWRRLVIQAREALGLEEKPE